MGRYLIDSSVLIEVERGRLDLDAVVAEREGSTFLVSVITVSELLYGVHRADSPRRRADRSAFVEYVLEIMPVLPVALASARLHAELEAALDAAGTPVGPHDLWIGACGVAHGLTLATGNSREFARIPGLDMEVWGS